MTKKTKSVDKQIKLTCEICKKEFEGTKANLQRKLDELILYTGSGPVETLVIKNTCLKCRKEILNILTQIVYKKG